ncbi:Hypothetical protein D9617_21g097050 [Elsinoe fawcettii]|nr:Hypothetical protein D9617_21g097050 [Elsinoe fawcettii]
MSKVLQGLEFILSAPHPRKSLSELLRRDNLLAIAMTCRALARHCLLDDGILNQELVKVTIQCKNNIHHFDLRHATEAIVSCTDDETVGNVKPCEDCGDLWCEGERFNIARLLTTRRAPEHTMQRSTNIPASYERLPEIYRHILGRLVAQPNDELSHWERRRMPPQVRNFDDVGVQLGHITAHADQFQEHHIRLVCKRFFEGYRVFRFKTLCTQCNEVELAGCESTSVDVVCRCDVYDALVGKHWRCLHDGQEVMWDIECQLQNYHRQGPWLYDVELGEEGVMIGPAVQNIGDDEAWEDPVGCESPNTHSRVVVCTWCRKKYDQGPSVLVVGRDTFLPTPPRPPRTLKGRLARYRRRDSDDDNGRRAIRVR